MLVTYRLHVQPHDLLFFSFLAEVASGCGFGLPECEMDLWYSSVLVANQGEAQRQKYVSLVDGMVH